RPGSLETNRHGRGGNPPPAGSHRRPHSNRDDRRPLAAPDHRVFFPVPDNRRGVQEYGVCFHGPSEDKHTRGRMDPVTMSRSNTLDYLNNPSPQALGRSPLEWLNRLERPTVVRVAGRDPSRTRAMATLLHGNEPSGLFAIHRWLLEQHTPEVNL